MAVIKESKAQEAGPVETVSIVLLELTVIGRYVVAGNLYEKGMAYEFTEEQALKMLRLQDDRGIPVFKRYLPKQEVKTAGEDGPIVVDMKSGKPTVEVVSPSGVKAINIGDDDELRAAGIDLGRGDLSRDDLGEGVRV